MRVLLLGNGAREHAIAEAIMRSKRQPVLFSYMKANNPGIAQLSSQVKIGSYSDLGAIKDFAINTEVDFAFIGPEDPLEKGVVDALEEIGIPCVGPKKTLARLETSKGFTREIMAKYNIKGSPLFKVFTDMDGIEEFLQSLSGFVVKPDGLTGGKGVKVQGEHLADIAEALDYCKEVLETHPSVVVEEKLEGEEFSLQCITDGKTVVITPPVQDHKRAYANDEGPNTGGMGSYSCADHLLPFLTKQDVEEGLRITKEMATALHEETGELYKGVMYAGLIVTKSGVKLIEYNARFGDPEAMNIMPIMKTDFVDLCMAVVKGELHKIKMEFENKATVCKYAVPEGYPDKPVRDVKVAIGNIPLDAKLYYASIDKKKDGLYMTGSRAIGAVGIADKMADAEKAAEEAVRLVKGPVFHREDIGTERLLAKRVEHMKKIRLKLIV